MNRLTFFFSFFQFVFFFTKMCREKKKTSTKVAKNSSFSLSLSRSVGLRMQQFHSFPSPESQKSHFFKKAPSEKDPYSPPKTPQKLTPFYFLESTEANWGPAPVPPLSCDPTGATKERLTVISAAGTLHMGKERPTANFSEPLHRFKLTQAVSY